MRDGLGKETVCAGQIGKGNDKYARQIGKRNDTHTQNGLQSRWGDHEITWRKFPYGSFFYEFIVFDFFVLYGDCSIMFLLLTATFDV